MQPMGYYNDYYFNLYYKQYHQDDNSLVCQNNILYYYGDDQVISGMIIVRQNEKVNLHMFRLSNLNVNQWKMKPYELFFFLRETLKLEDVDINSNILDVRKLASKRYLEETDKLSLNYIVDYHNALKTIEPNLSGVLADSLNLIKTMFDEIKEMSSDEITDGCRLIYEKLFGELKNNIDSGQSNSNGNVRTRHDGNNHKSHITPIYQGESDNSEILKKPDAAFISVVILIVLMLAIIFGTITYIYS